MANDMHLAHNLPPIWYECHQVIPGDLDVYGFTFIGTPIVIAGHNRYCAWGFTNVGADVTDYFYYKDSNDGKSYWNATSGSWQEYKFISERIKIKQLLGTSTKTIHIKLTGDNSPIITPDVHEEDYKIPVAMKWTGSEPTFEIKAIWAFNHMKNLGDFIQAQNDTWFCPGQNVIFADIYGNIALRPVAHYPIRAPGYWGRIPENGSAGEGEWLGYIPYDELPVSANPPQGYLASANQKTAGPNYPYFLGSFFDVPYRGQRINEILANAPDGSVTVKLMEKWQADNVDNSAKSFVPVILGIDPTKAGEQQEQVQAVQSKLASWNFTMLRDWVEPTIYHFWLDIFLENTFKDEWALLGLDDDIDYPQLHVLEQLVANNASVRWFDDNTTSQPETLEYIALKSLLDALEEMKEEFGTSNIGKWIWGNYHRLYVDHLAGLDALSANSDGYPWDGSGCTLNAAYGGEREDYGVRHGPSERFVVDFERLANNESYVAWSCLPGGQRGWALSKHYKDQLEDLWLQYKYHECLFYGTADVFPAAQIESKLILKQ
jgi:penicillin amidase